VETFWDIVTWGSRPWDFRWVMGDFFFLCSFAAFGYVAVLWVKTAWQDYRKFRRRSYDPSGQ
jgi:hypothetical protein